MFKKLNEKRVYPKNPIGVIALFVFLIEVISTITFKILVDANLPHALSLYMVLFITIFPLIIIFLFFIILWFRREALYSPKDFREDESFFKLFNNRLERVEIRQQASQVDLRGRVDDVFEMIKILIEKKDIEAAMNLGKALLKVRRYEGSFDAFKIIIESPSLSDYDLARAFANTAYCLINLGRFGEAIEYLNGVREKNQAKAESFWPSLAMAYASQKTGHIEEYEVWLKKVKNSQEFNEFRNVAIDLYPEWTTKFKGENPI